jgi:hypothetical protein
MKINIDIEIEGEKAIDTLRKILGASTEPSYVKAAKSVLAEQKPTKGKGKHPFNGIDTALLLGVWNNANNAQEVCDYYGANKKHRILLQNKVSYLRKKGMKFKHFNKV